MALRERFSGLRLRLYGGQSTVEPNRLLRHFTMQLDDEFLVSLAARPSGADPLQPIIDRIEDRLNVEPPEWNAAYQAERLLVQLKPSALLERDLDRRVAEAKASNLASAPVFEAQLADLKARSANLTANEIEEHRRAILIAITGELQWNYAKRFVVRKHLWDAAHVLPAIGIIVFLFAGLPYLAFLVQKFTPLTLFTWLMQGMPNYGLFSAISFGLIGAFFSRLLALQTGAARLTVEDAEQMFKPSFIIVRAAVGMIGALIIYFLLQSGLAQVVYVNAIIPDFTKLNFVPVDLTTMFDATKTAKVLIPSKDWSLLLIWSVLAGFSERLVPDTLSRVELRLTGNPGQATGKGDGAGKEPTKPKP